MKLSNFSWRTASFVALGAMLVSLAPLRATADSSANRGSHHKKAAASANASAATSPEAAPASADSSAAAAAPAANPAPAAVGMGASVATSDRAVDDYGLIPATGGPLGLFTVESGDTLPKYGWSFSVDANRFGRMPGELVVTDFGINAGYGLTDYMELYVNFIPDTDLHVGAPTQLTDLTTTGFTATHPVYSEDFPFATKSQNSLGPITFGVKFGVASQDRGSPVSVGLKAGVIVPTLQTFTALLGSGQTGQAGFEFGGSVSRNFGNIFTLDFDATADIVRSPRDQGVQLFDQASNVRVGGGVILFPHKRIQVMNEYVGEIYSTGETPTQTFGPRDPVDAVWGVRLFPAKMVGIDLGYRYMLNTTDLQDRNGFVIKIGTAFAPKKAAPPVDHPPTVTCTADPTSVFFGSGDQSAVNCPAVSPDNDTLTYNWTASCGSVDGTGPMVHWLSAGVPIGTCTVTVHVDDGHGGAATGSADIQVVPKPNHPPVISCSADRSTVFIGEKVHITANASDPDGDPLTFTWTTNGGTIDGTGSAVDLDTTGAAAGSYTVTGRVDDGRGGAADCTVGVVVNAPPPPPMASKLSECLFAPAGSPRVDNVCKRILDDAALRLQNDPHATAVIIGYADPKEMHPAKLALLRAQNAVKYLGDKGIDASRITTRAGTGQVGGGKENMRIDFVLVPEGATY